jgi:molybdate transport system regulatory protein
MADDTFPLDKLRVKKKVWLEFDGKNLLGEGGARLLDVIGETHSLTVAAERLGYSYKYAWTRLKKMHERTGIPLVDAHKGGTGGGGHVELTPWGELILKYYKDAENATVDGKNNR